MRDEFARSAPAAGRAEFGVVHEKVGLRLEPFDEANRGTRVVAAYISLNLPCVRPRRLRPDEDHDLELAIFSSSSARQEAISAFSASSTSKVSVAFPIAASLPSDLATPI